jgi:hypothetical protein
MARLRWFIAGAAAAAGALVVYKRSRSDAFDLDDFQPTPVQEPSGPVPVRQEPPPAAAFATIDPEATQEMRARIDQTRARIAEKAAAKAAKDAAPVEAETASE